MTNSEQELQQLNMFLVLPLLFCFIMLGTSCSRPDSTLARVLALIPPFTPLLMYLRVSLGHPAPWEIALSDPAHLGQHLRHRLGHQPHLSHRRPDVRQAPQHPRNPPLAQIQLAGAAEAD
jgi:hypothetical protein